MHLKSPFNLSLISSAPLASIVLALLPASPARAATIISDTFTGTSGTALTAHTPNTDLPGSSYFTASQGGTPSIQGNAASLDTNASAFLSIASKGSYVKPTSLTISGDLTLGNIENNSPDLIPGFTIIRGVGLGFVSFTAAGNSRDNFTGLMLSPTGSLALEAGNDLVPNTSLQTVAYDPADFNNVAFSSSTAYTLSYSINTTTGAITAATLSDGNGSESYSFSTAAFTDTQTTNAGFYISAANGLGTGTVDNFTLTGPLGAAPEPSTWALFLTGFLGLLGWQRFRRNA